MGRTHDYYCHKCREHWSPLGFAVCPSCETDTHSEYDLNHELNVRSASNDVGHSADPTERLD